MAQFLGLIIFRIFVSFAAALFTAASLSSDARLHDAYRDGIRELSQAKIHRAHKIDPENCGAARDFNEADNTWERR